MPVDSGGNVTRPASPIPVSGQTADAPQVNVPIEDIYAVLNMLMFLDGRKSLRGNIPMNGYRASNAGDAVSGQDYVTLAQVQSMMSGAGSPTGTIMPYTISSASPPSGWIFANGQTLLRASYAPLWSAVQAGNNLAVSEGAKTDGQYGPGNGSTTFTVPNLMVSGGGYFIRPSASDRSIGTIQSDEFKSHSHSGSTNSAGNHSHGYQRMFLTGGSNILAGGSPYNMYEDWGDTESAGSHTHSLSISNAGGSETRPKNTAYPMIIKV